MFDELNAMAASTRQFLVKAYGGTSGDWFDQKVVRALSYNQADKARREGWTSLDDLDLQGLLRVVDQNWFELERASGIDRDARNWLKEMQGVRNRWAHVSPGKFPTADQRHRDLDTMVRLSEALGGPSEYTDLLVASRSSALQELTGHELRGAEAAPQPPRPFTEAPEPSHPVQSMTSLPAGLLTVGTQIELVSNPTITGVVVNEIPGGAEPQYLVFHSASSMKTYYASQIRARDTAAPERTGTAHELRAQLTAFLIREGSSSDLFSLNSGRIDYEPYQFRPVMKILASDRPRLLVADDVGVGKTIEAGLILKELAARQPLETVMIICPKPLVTAHKWADEMKRFDEDFVALDGATLRHCIDEYEADGEWPARYRRCIVPYSLLDEKLLLGTTEGRRPRPGLSDLVPRPQFDLLIVDEAHHLRNRATLAHQNVALLVEEAAAAVFLSATPIQMRSEDLYVLLSLLRPDLFSSVSDFYAMAEPNRFVMEASAAARGAGEHWQEVAREALHEALSTEWGTKVMRSHPALPRAMALLEAESPSHESRVDAIRAIENLNTFASVVNRTRRRDIGSFTMRKAETVSIDFTPAQRAVFDALFDVSRDILATRGQENSEKFLLSTLHRQAASSLNGLAGFIEDILSRRMGEEILAEIGGDDVTSVAFASSGRLSDRIRGIGELANALDGEDPKYTALADIVLEKRELETSKTLVFSSFRHTLRYLDARLTTDGLRVGLVHGGLPDADREEVRRRFALPGDLDEALDVLLSSEVGTEGLDYQFCDLLVNYDLPWNPMRVEQRIGRIDRRGQKSEAVVIKNLITPGTIDADVYERCLLRIGVFEHALGGGEEILGRLADKLRRIAEDFNLTDDERRARIQQLSDNDVARIRELESLEEQQSDLLGLDIRNAHRQAVADASSLWLSPEALAGLVRHYLEATHPDLQLLDTPDGDYVLRAQEPGKAVLYKATAAESHARRGEHKGWSSWLKSKDQRRRLVTDAQKRQDPREAELLYAGHPLVSAASRSDLSDLAVDLVVTSEALPAGRYPFATYAWSTHGVKAEARIEFIAHDETVATLLPSLISEASDSGSASVLEAEVLTQLEERAFERWSKAREQHRSNVETHAHNAVATLEYGHAGRVEALRKQRAQVHDERIWRMRDSQIAAADREYKLRRDTLLAAIDRADIVTTRCGYGVLTVVAP